jgi:hypothetical protein
MIGLVCQLQIAATEALVAIFVNTEHFVDDVHVNEFVGVTLGDRFQSSVDLDFEFSAVLTDPIGLEGVVNQTVTLHADLVFLAEFDDRIHGRPSVNVYGILSKARIAFFGLKRVPIERNDGKVEKPCELLAVSSSSFLILELIEIERVTAEFEFVRDLLDLQLHVLERISVFIREGKRERTLPVFFDITVQFGIEIEAEAVKLIDQKLHLLFVRHGKNLLY